MPEPLDTKTDYVTAEDTVVSPGDSGIRPAMIGHIRQALVTSRVTLAGQSTGADPYNSRRDRRRASVWGTKRDR
jgi:hypothetical protein